MTQLISTDLRVRGFAQVMVMYRPRDVDDVREAMGRVGKHFVTRAHTQLAAIAADVAAKAPPPVLHFPNLGVSVGTVDRKGLVALRRDRKRVGQVRGTPVLRPIRPVKSVPASLEAIASSVTWGLQMLEVEALWSAGFRGNGILVGHLDTGLDGTHPALSGAIANHTVFDDLGRSDPTPRDPPVDTATHGTHTAATIVGRPVEGKHVGVAPAARLASATVIEGGDVVARVLGGMDWAVGQGVRVLNMSLGLPGYLDDWLDITRILRTRGILPVFAVGNEGAGTSRSPGNYAEALSVGAIDEARTVATFSSSDRFRRARDPIVPDLVGPGVDVISAAPGGGWANKSGSSMATPHIAGLAALLLEAVPDATVSDLESAILASCRGVPPLNGARAGHGYPHGPAALAALRA